MSNEHEPTTIELLKFAHRFEAQARAALREVGLTGDPNQYSLIALLDCIQGVAYNAMANAGWDTDTEIVETLADFILDRIEGGSI